MRQFIIPSTSQIVDESATGGIVCPIIPRTVTVWADDRKDALTKVASALETDPELKELHPELFDAPDGEKPKKSKKKDKNA